MMGSSGEKGRVEKAVDWRALHGYREYSKKNDVRDERNTTKLIRNRKRWQSTRIDSSV